MKRKKNSVFILVFLFIIFSITIGYAYLSSNLTMLGNVIVKKYEPPRYLYNEVISQNKENGLMVLDNQASTYVSASTGIDFGVAPSDTNGKGVYVRNGTENDSYPIYYYRGDVTNNNVAFAGFCWKMVRTTETGGIKLIYNGVLNNDICNNTDEESEIGKSIFNDNGNSNAYVGYMYGTPNSNTYEAEHLSTKDSTSSIIKNYIDEWYRTNMINYTEYLEDTIWCNDRSVNSGTGVGVDDTFYNPFKRTISTPSLECVNQNDRFTVNEIIEGRLAGNGALTYPVALLTVDEVTLAGILDFGYGNNGYLTTNSDFWLLSPRNLYEGSAAGFYVYDGGFYPNGVSSNAGVRPSISLASGTKISNIGDGSVNNPFVVE